MKFTRMIISGMSLFLAGLCTLTAQMVYEAPQKKLIDFSQHSPYMKYYKEHVKDFEKGPFDGITMKLSAETGGGNVFMVDNWSKVTDDDRAAEKKLATLIAESPVLTDNFLVLFGASQMDWFSDEDWVLVEDYIRYATAVEKALIPPVLWSKHSSSFRIGHAIAPEYIQGNWLGMKPFPYKLTGQGVMMLPEEKAK
jgi:hypothetical protein